MLEFLAGTGLRIGVLSDASAEIAAGWHASPLARLVHAAVFSCVAGHVKPDQRLYDLISHELAVPAYRTLYLGDGGGNELNGALAFGMPTVAVHRRGRRDALAFGDSPWSGSVIDSVEDLPAYLAELS
jgi:putative hydrolase of the HAD superfamily